MGLRFHPQKNGDGGGDGGGSGGDGGGGGDGSGGGNGGGSGGGSGGGDDGGDDDKKFSQTDVNSIMKKEREKFQSKQRETLGQLEELRKEKNLSDEQAKKLDDQIAGLRTDLMSEKERAEAEKKRLSDEHQRALEDAKGELTEWQSRFETQTRNNAILEAASKHKAFNANQIVALVGPKTVVTAVHTDDGKPTGKFVALVREFVTADGKTTEKLTPVTEYVEALKGQKEYANLFLAERAGGTGYRPGTGGDGSASGDMSSADKIRTGLGKGQAQRGAGK